MWGRRVRTRAFLVALPGFTILAVGMAAGSRGETYAAYSDFAIFHNSAREAAPDPALPAVPSACGGLSHAHVRYGTPGRDRLTAYPDARVLMGLAGDDTLVAGAGRSCLVGGPGTDACVGTLRVDVFVGCEEVIRPDLPSGPPVPSGPLAVPDPSPTDVVNPTGDPTPAGDPSPVGDPSPTGDPSLGGDPSPTADATLTSQSAP